MAGTVMASKLLPADCGGKCGQQEFVDKQSLKLDVDTFGATQI